MTIRKTAGEAAFCELAEPLLAGPGVERSTMMGLPCLRLAGAFFASCDRRTGDLLIKLTEPRVDELVASGQAVAFAPAGRRLREWAAVPEGRSQGWQALLDEALQVASDRPPARWRRADRG
jgi:hypothetical protein